jgi:hypothetical protein
VRQRWLRQSPLRSYAAGRLDSAVIGTLATAIAALMLYAFLPQRARYPAAVPAIVAFGLVPLLFPAVRLRTDKPVCPQNWVSLIFFFQLVVNPLLLTSSGPYINTLPRLPPDRAINVALLIAVLAFCGYASGMQLDARHGRGTKPHAAGGQMQWTSHPWRVAGVYFVLGLIGLFIAFRTPHNLIDYFRDASGHVGALNQEGQTGASKVTSVTLRAFLGFAVIVPFCVWLDKPPRPRGWKLASATIAAALLVLVFNATFSYNRAAFVAPLIALAGALGARTLRLRLSILLPIGLVALALLTGFRAYRNSTDSVGNILSSAKARNGLISHVSLSKEIQIYTNAPQYLGYLLDRTDFGATPHYGRTLLASAMYPVPALGAPFRSYSGVEIFNHLIYGPSSTDTDQNIPFQGELFLDFAYVGVLVGFFAFGLLVGRVQKAFQRSRSSLEAFTWQYAGIWLGFLVVGSIAVVSQTALYFFWPVIIVAGLHRWRHVHDPPHAAMVAEE